MTNASSTDASTELVDVSLADQREASSQQTAAWHGASGQYAKFTMLASYSFATWGERCWEFSIALFLVELNHNSLLYIAAYGLMEDILRIVFGSPVGKYIDRTDRLQAGSTMCLLQNMCIAASAAAAALALITREEQEENKLLAPALAGACVILGSLGSVGSLGLKAALEGDWPKALCGEDSQALTGLNSVLRGIDMACLLLAPLLASLLMQFLGMLPTVLFLLLFNLLGAVPEVLLMRAAYGASPSLRKPKQHGADSPPPVSDAKDLPSKLDPPTHPTPSDSSLLATARQQASEFISTWRVYCQQRVVLAGMALAVLYCTCLSLGYLMTAYIKARGMGESSISVFRGVGAITGLSATLLFPWLAPRLGLKGCGLLGIFWQLGWLLLGVVPSLLAHTGLLGAAAAAASANDALLYVLLLGLAVSRFGLWLFDLAVAQLQQEEVAEEHIGSVNAIQGSLSSGMELLMFGLAMAAPHPPQFPWLMLLSLGVVGSAAAMFIAYSRRSSRGGGSGPAYTALTFLRDEKDVA